MTDRIKGELAKVTAALVVSHPRDHSALFAAQQALAWVLSPETAQAPLAMIMREKQVSGASNPPFEPT